jgi:hypothetical protein
MVKAGVAPPPLYPRVGAILRDPMTTPRITRRALVPCTRSVHGEDGVVRVGPHASDREFHALG